MYVYEVHPHKHTTPKHIDEHINPQTQPLCVVLHVILSDTHFVGCVAFYGRTQFAPTCRKSHTFLRNTHNLSEKNTPYGLDFSEKIPPIGFIFRFISSILSIIVGFGWDEMINHLIQILFEHRRCVVVSYFMMTKHAFDVWWVCFHSHLCVARVICALLVH